MKKNTAIILIILAIAIGLGYLLGPGKGLQGRLIRPTISPAPSRPQEEPNLLLFDISPTTKVPPASKLELSGGYHYQYLITVKNTSSINVTPPIDGILESCTVIDKNGTAITGSGNITGGGNHYFSIFPEPGFSKYESKTFVSSISLGPNIIPGQYFVKCTIDPNNVVQESNEDDNTKTFPIEFPPSL